MGVWVRVRVRVRVGAGVGVGLGLLVRLRLGVKATLERYGSHGFPSHSQVRCPAHARPC